MIEEFRQMQKNVAALMSAQAENVKTIQREEDIKAAMLDEMESQEKALLDKDAEIAKLRQQLDEKSNQEALYRSHYSFLFQEQQAKISLLEEESAIKHGDSTANVSAIEQLVDEAVTARLKLPTSSPAKRSEMKAEHKTWVKDIGSYDDKWDANKEHFKPP